MPILDVVPEKRIFLSIISEYDLNLSICELIDNAIDLWTKEKKTSLIVKIDLDESRQTIIIEDNAGGIPEGKLDHIISPGKTSNDITDDVIGYFGVGSKRAVVALAEEITIDSRYSNKQAFVIHFNDEWINDGSSWEIEYKKSNKPIPEGATRIELSKLRSRLVDHDIELLRAHLSEVYAYFLKLVCRLS